MSAEPINYVVCITDTATGETRVAPQTLPWHGQGGDVFWWTEGNFGCDCNRGMEFDRAIGGSGLKEGPPGWQCGNEGDPYPCGHWRYSIKEATLPDGTTVLLDSAIPRT